MSCPWLEPGISQIKIQNITISANLLGMFPFVDYFMMLLVSTLYSELQDDELQNDFMALYLGYKVKLSLCLIS
jgi:hypothetical protein